MPVDLRDPSGGTANRGPALVYVLPCVFEDLVKLGFSRDPLQRAQSLHPRYFEFFDFERALLLETESVRDARAVELRLRRLLVEHNAPAPMTVSVPAGGHTEWYRGADERLRAELHSLAASGHTLHAPALPWFARSLAARLPLLHDWADAIARAEDLEHVSLSRPLQRNLRDSLDAYTAFGIDTSPWLPARVADWYARVSRR